MSRWFEWNLRWRSWHKFVQNLCVSIRYPRGSKKKKEKTGKKYRSIFHSSQKTTSCIGLKRVRCISCFYIPPNVVSTALNEYTDSRELFRFVIRFLFVVSFTFVYFTMCSNVESVPVTSIIFEQINLFDVECYITFPRPVKKPWNLHKTKLRRKEKACRIENVNVRYSVIEAAAGYSSRFFFFFFYFPLLPRLGKFDIQIQWRGVTTHAVETTSIYNSPNLCTVRYNGFGWFYQALPGKGCYARCGVHRIKR